MITFCCIPCGKQFQVGDEFKGRAGKCPRCGTVLEEQGEAPQAVPPPPLTASGLPGVCEFKEPTSPAKPSPPKVTAKQTLLGCGCLAIMACAGLAVLAGLVSIAKNAPVSTYEASTIQTTAVAIPEPTMSWNDYDYIFNKSNLTDLQKDAEWEKLVGKKIRWSGWVCFVNRTKRGWIGMSVTMNVNTASLVDVFVKLKNDQEKEAIKLVQLSPVTFEGTFNIRNPDGLKCVGIADGIIVK